MENFIEFLDSYKELLASVLCMILTIVCMLVKRKPQTVDQFIETVSDCLNQVPCFVSSVEHPGDGASKKDEVIKMCLLYCRQKLGRSLSDFEKADIISMCSHQIEMVLTTPQKKEVL